MKRAPSILLAALAFLLMQAIPVLSQQQAGRFRGFMIDAPRTTESLAYYFRIIDLCQANDLNTIIFRLTDDEGSAYQFSSHPDLVMCAGAYSTAEIKEIITYAQQRGIEIIPEIETFGHARYITQAPRYQHLNDAVDMKAFNAICPVNDSTLALMKDLIAEVAAIFPSRYLHIGCDETNWGGSELSKRALQSKSKNQLWAEYVNKLNGYVNDLGKETIIWGDLPIYNENQVLDLLNTNIIIADWNYWENDPEKVNAIAGKLLEKGFRIIGCPAISWCKWGARIGAAQFKNISAYAQVYTTMTQPNNLGLILTNWVPQKYLQYSQWDSFVIAAAIARHHGRYDYTQALPGYVENTFGVRYDPDWARIYNTLYTYSPQSSCADADSLPFIPWAAEAQVKRLLERTEKKKNPFGDVKALLLAKQKKIRKNTAIFNDLLYTVELLDYLLARENNLVAFGQSPTVDLAAAGKYFTAQATRDSIFLSTIKSRWQRGRRSVMDDADKDYFYSFARAAAFSRQLAKQPATFLEMTRQHQ